VIRVIALMLRIGLGGIFLYTGGLHVLNARDFVQAVANYELVPPFATMLLGLYLPWVELFAALGVIARRLYLGSLAAMGGMLLVFIGAIVSAWHRGLDISCGCFREAEKITTHFPQLVARDVAMLAAVAVLVGIEWLSMRRMRLP
jgi:hypothetical protein